MIEEKNDLMGIKKLETNHDQYIKNSNLGQQRMPQIDVREIGSSLEAILITGVDFPFLFTDTIRVIHQEGFDVFNATFSILIDTIFHTIHAQNGRKRLDGFEQSEERTMER
ncbi:hypothetical protein L1887_20547 [Cichorium endivia]|nr:hypothetical protein L1887_20547 [Cichorium endivia]